MAPTPGLTHWLILAALAVGGILVLIGMVRTLRAAAPPRDPEATPWFRLPLAILIAVCAYLVVAERDEPLPAAQVAVSTSGCPERRANEADAIVLTVHSYADGRPEDRRVSCKRITQRLYEITYPHLAGAQ